MRPTTEREVPKVFISHSTYDREFVESELIPALASHGVDSWYSKQDIQGASEWAQRIVTGLQECDWFLVVMSRRSSESQWVRDEVHWAMDHRWERIVPVLLDDCDPMQLHLRLRRVQYIDFRRDRKRAKEELVRIWEPATADTKESRRVNKPTSIPSRSWKPNQRTLMLTICVLGMASWVNIAIQNPGTIPDREYIGLIGGTAFFSLPFILGLGCVIWYKHFKQLSIIQFILIIIVMILCLILYGAGAVVSFLTSVPLVACLTFALNAILFSALLTIVFTLRPRSNSTQNRT
jgi:TIR domain